jgi:hypothetical protein
MKSKYLIKVFALLSIIQVILSNEESERYDKLIVSPPPFEENGFLEQKNELNEQTTNAEITKKDNNPKVNENIINTTDIAPINSNEINKLEMEKLYHSKDQPADLSNNLPQPISLIQKDPVTMHGHVDSKVRTFEPTTITGSEEYKPKYIADEKKNIDPKLLEKQEMYRRMRQHFPRFKNIHPHEKVDEEEKKESPTDSK